MNKIIWTEDGTEFVVRDTKGFLHYPTPRELHKFATAKEIAEATHRHEAAQTPLPSYDPSTGLYYWDNTDDQWDEADVAADASLLWPGMPVDLLLLSARLMAALGITD